jgi:hypothetical protein
MTDSKVILHDIFYDTSVNSLRTYPLLYTAGMCDVMHIGVYNTYLHRMCFLSTLYNNTRWFKYDQDICGLFTQKSVPVIFEPPCTICLTSSQSTLFIVSSDSRSHTYATSQSSSLCTDQSHFLQKYCVLHANTRDTAIVFL